MDENNSIIFLAFFSLFIFVASICSCVDRVINRRTTFSRIENIITIRWNIVFENLILQLHHKGRIEGWSYKSFL